MDIKELVGANLQAIRESRGLTQAAVADACEFEAPSYSRWENGKSWPSPATISRLAKFYNVPQSYFYRDEQARKVKPTLDEALGVLREQTGIVLSLPSVILNSAKIPDKISSRLAGFQSEDKVWELIEGVLDGLDALDSTSRNSKSKISV
ncbi:MAG: helix-turn-helix domain-containing protein [Bacteriovoracaceae bacterium]